MKYLFAILTTLMLLTSCGTWEVSDTYVYRTYPDYWYYRPIIVRPRPHHPAPRPDMMPPQHRPNQPNQPNRPRRR